MSKNLALLLQKTFSPKKGKIMNSNYCHSCRGFLLRSNESPVFQDLENWVNPFYLQEQKNKNPLKLLNGKDRYDLIVNYISLVNYLISEGLCPQDQYELEVFI